MSTHPSDQPKSDFPEKLSQPARRALIQAGYLRLAQLTEVSVAELSRLHGVGPKAIGQLRDAVGAQGLSFAEA